MRRAGRACRPGLGSVLALGAGLALAFDPSVAASAEPVDGAAIVAEISRRVAAIEEEYPGNYSRRQIVRTVLDPDDGSVREITKIEADVWEFVGKKQQMKILSCEQDGEKLSPDECEPDLQGEPMYRIFGPEGKKNYDIKWTGDTTIDGKPAHRLEVLAREKTARHFQGNMYFATGSLDVLRVEGGLAKYPFGLKALSLELNFVDVNGNSMLGHGTSDLTIYVPLLYNQRMVTKFSASDQKRLTASQRPKD